MSITPINASQAIGWLSQGKAIGLKDNKFYCYDWKDNVRAVFHQKDERNELQKIVNLIQKNLEGSSGDNKAQWLKLSTAVIKKYANDGKMGKVVAVFDRQLVKQGNIVSFSHPKNQAALEKWKKYDMEEELYKKHPEFSTFLETSGLLSQIKVTRSEGNTAVRPKEIDGEAALFVNGEWMKWSQLKATFEAVYSSHYHETFVIHKETRDVYTFLDNGRGLQPHHPFLTELSPVSKLNEEEYQKVLDKAHCFIRPEEASLTDADRAELNKDRSFVIQIVSSYTSGSKTKAGDLIYHSKHPYLRLIVGEDNPQLNIKKGDVYEVGYGWKKAVKLPLIASQGQFRSPDLWEYKSVKDRIVTNVPVSKEEAHAFYKFTQRYHRDGVNLGKATGFHLIRQNCTTYVRSALQAAGVTLPTEIALDDLLREITPNWFKTLGAGLKWIAKTAGAGISRAVTLLPRAVKDKCDWVAAKVKEVALKAFVTIAAVCSIPLRFLLGGGLGTGGVAFAPPGKPEKRINPELANLKAWLSLSHYKFNLPGILQRWQREQASTFVSHNPIKLAIVP